MWCITASSNEIKSSNEISKRALKCQVFCCSLWLTDQEDSRSVVPTDSLCAGSRTGCYCPLWALAVVCPSHTLLKMFQILFHTSCKASRTSCIRIVEVFGKINAMRHFKSETIFKFNLAHASLCIPPPYHHDPQNHTMKFSLSDKCKMKTSSTVYVLLYTDRKHKHMIHQVCAKWPTVLCRSHL